MVNAHPLKNSLCGTFTDQIFSILNGMGHDVILEDLYDTAFDPVLTADERKSYYQETYDASGLNQHTRRLLQADGLVIIFPTWWFGFPAILKGWFDRVWVPTVAYDHADDFGPIKPRLDKLKKVFVVTTLGAPWWVDVFVLWRPLKRVIRFALLGACAGKCELKYLSFYKCETVDQKRMKACASKIEAVLTKWFR